MNNYIFPFLWMRGEPEEVIRREMEKISECGIRAVCVEARPHDDFCGPGWWHDMDIVIDEAKKRDMKIWILDDKHFPTGYAAGLIETHYPERKKWYLADTTADVFGGSHTRALNIERMKKPVIGYWQIGAPANDTERANNRLYAVVATKFASENTFEPKTIDLTDACKDGVVTFALPEGQWRIHVLYLTRTDGGNESYINMLDAVSAHTQIEGVYESHYARYKEEFGKTIAGFFSDEPAIGNTSEVTYEAKLGKAGMPLPWSNELEEMLAKRYPGGFRELLPFLFVTAKESDCGAQLRYEFMDCVTRLYEKNFSVPIGEWCRAHGVEYIGHVVEDCGTHSRMGMGPGHWFRAMTGQDMAGIDVIGNQVIYGAPFETRKGMGGMELDGEFFHYILGKLGASAGHLDPKKKGRTMCELFGAYGWSYGVRDMKYLLDHLLSRGVNYLVPHAFSMAQYPDIDCPPHFYAGGHNPQFPWFAELMKYANRICGLLNGGTHEACVAVLYDGESDWPGDHLPMQKVGRILQENQIEFDVVSLDMLKNLSAYHGKMENGKLVINGVSFDALLIPFADYLPAEAAAFGEGTGGLPVYYVGGYPTTILKGRENTWPAPGEWKKYGVEVSLDQLAQVLKECGMSKLSVTPAFPQLSVYHYRKEGQIFFLLNEAPDEAFCGEITLPATERLAVYDGWKDQYYDLLVAAEEKGTTIQLELEPGQSLVILEKTVPGVRESGCIWKSFRQERKECTAVLELKDGWKTELIGAWEHPQEKKGLPMESLVPVSDLEPAFSGIIRYTCSFALDHIPERAYFKAEQVFEVMRVQINGEGAGSCIRPPYQLELTGKLKEGTNTIVVEVANTPARDQANYPMPPFDFQHDPVEPSGMYGRIALYLK